ncbi:hypothetical protein H257_16816 [Aphanomyces astaci]|uniref:EF-hand domain-containing protein n=1 Tax=Aphanomyces astaci TaxID=112090 RepID=W4FH88_APHAT|nr:hypothetical protein H257_16816 [Aphanomyces astaci]ETV66887.1 hypothetical protein H257_16816 [Aphanomyces astaci]|eukprot:XP_009843690.1 hypothetical protein H257_16816 [Aphanomyces astaci]
MGPKLSIEAKYTSASPILKEYRQVHLREIRQVIQNYDDMQREYGDIMAVNQDQFDQLFSVVCSDTAVHFQEFDSRGVGRVDVLEVLAVLIVFSKDLIEPKIQALFSLFDFDKTCYISHTELVMLMICCTRGLCRVVGLERPENLELECLANEAFAKIDSNRNNRVSLSKFSFWLHHEQSVILYLKKFASTRLIADAMLLYDKQLKLAIDLFLAAAVVRHKSSLGNSSEGAVSYPACTLVQVRSVIAALKLRHLQPAGVDEVIGYMTHMVEANEESTNPVIVLPNFLSVMSPALAFFAADDDHSMTVDVHELRILLWLMRKKEPTDLQTKGMLLALDDDENGKLSCMEWVHYASGIDQSTGSLAFNAQLRYLFEHCDREGNGSIHVADFSVGLKTVVTRCVHAAIPRTNKVGDKKWAIIDDMLASLVKEIMDCVDVNNSKTIEWKKFKAHLEFIEDRVAKVKSYVLEFIVVS